MEIWMKIFTLMFLNVMSLSYADPIPDPEPEPNVVIDIEQYVGGIVGGQKTSGSKIIDTGPLQALPLGGQVGGQKTSGSCWLGDTEYRNGAILQRGCVDIQCEDGVWINLWWNGETCGSCVVVEGLDLYPYDRHDINNTGIKYNYNYQGKGCYVTSQRTYSPASPYVAVGVYSKLVPCTPISPAICVKRLKYNEDLFVWPPFIDINVIWGSAGIPVVENFGTPVTRFPATVPPVVIFQGPPACILIVGSKGLSVYVCQLGDYLNVDVYAVRSAANMDLRGLCDRYTDVVLFDYYARPSTPTTSVTTFAGSWKLTGSQENYCDQ